RCPYKAFKKMNGHTGSQSKFEALEHELQRDFKIQAEISLSTLTASGNIVTAPSATLLNRPT
ncbi:MAG: hypothetical protein NTV34_08170, partial [Proteobacteria bacterium]|nr:hypothetical protein [Pseudomonadota bacterium]